MPKCYDAKGKEIKCPSKPIIKQYTFNPGLLLNNKSDNTTLVINTPNGPKTVIAPNSVPKINLNEIIARKKEADKKEILRRKAVIKASNDAKPLSRDSFQKAAAGEKFRAFPDDPNSIFDEYINPAKFVGDMADGIGHAWADPNSSVGDKVLSVATPLVVGALGSLGTTNTKQFINNVVNPFAGTGELFNNLGNKYLPNAYKANPFAKGNILNKFDKNNFYRQVDDETFVEALESGFIRGKQNVDMTRGDNLINLNKAFGDDAYYNKGSLYYKNTKNSPYLFEAKLPEENFIPKVNGRTKKYTTENTSVRVSKEPISIFNPNVNQYKKDWLKGYQQIPEYLPMKETNFHHQGMQKFIDNPITVQRLKALGVSDEGIKSIKLPRLSHLGDGERSYYDSFNGWINMDHGQIKSLNEIEKLHLPTKTVYDHEFGHFLQDQISTIDNKNAFMKSRNLNDAYLAMYEKNPDLFNMDYSDFLDNLNAKSVEYKPMQTNIYDDIALNLSPKKNLEARPNHNYNYFSSGFEPTAFVREMRSNMIANKLIKDHTSPVSKEVIEKFIEKNPTDRISSFLDTKNPDNIIDLKYLLNNIPAATGVLGMAAMGLKNKNQKSYQQGGKVLSQMGYRDDSPFKNRKSININTPSGLIDMSSTGVPLLAKDNTGMIKYLRPYSGQHQFRGNQVLETKMFQSGGFLQKPCYTCGGKIKKFQPGGVYPGMLSAMEELERQRQLQFNPIIPQDVLQGNFHPKNNISNLMEDEVTGANQSGPSGQSMYRETNQRQLAQQDSEKGNMGFPIPENPEEKEKKNGFGIIDGLIGVNVGLRAWSEKVEKDRQDEYRRKQFANNFNQTYSRAANDYGASDTRYLGYQQGGQFLNTSFNLSPNTYLKNPNNRFDRRGYPIPTREQYISDPEFYGMAPSKELLGKYSSVEGDGTGQPNPHSQYGKLMNNLEFMKNNNWQNSNNYRPENMHIAANYDIIKNTPSNKLPIAQAGGQFDEQQVQEEEEDNEYNFQDFIFDNKDEDQESELARKEKLDKEAQEREDETLERLKEQEEENLALQLAMESGPANSAFKRFNSDYSSSYGNDDGETDSESGYNLNSGLPVKAGQDELSKAKLAKDYLISVHGLSNELASGLLGNIHAESNFSSTVENGIGAFGLFQHLGTRRKDLKQFAASKGKPVTDFYTQLDFAVHELNTNHKVANKKYATPEAAAIGILNHFEKPSEEEKVNSVNKRVNFANKAFNFQKGGEYDLNQEEINDLVAKGYKINFI